MIFFGNKIFALAVEICIISLFSSGRRGRIAKADEFCKQNIVDPYKKNAKTSWLCGMFAPTMNPLWEAQPRNCNFLLAVFSVRKQIIAQNQKRYNFIIRHYFNKTFFATILIKHFLCFPKPSSFLFCIFRDHKKWKSAYCPSVIFYLQTLSIANFVTAFLWISIFIYFHFM